MTRVATQHAVAKFLAVDAQDLNKLRFIRRLVALARDIGRGRAVSSEDREDALRIIRDQSPHRSWNKARLSEARLVFDCYRYFDDVVAHLEESGEPYTWHEVISGLRRCRDGKPLPSLNRYRKITLRTELSRIARARGLAVETIEQRGSRLTVTFVVKKDHVRGV